MIIDIKTITEATWATVQELSLAPKKSSPPALGDEVRFSSGEIILHEGTYYAVRGLWSHTREVLFTSQKQIIATIISYGNVSAHRTVHFS